MVTVYWQCSKNTSPGPYFCLHEFETEEDEQQVKDKTITASCPVCDNYLTYDDISEEYNNEEDMVRDREVDELPVADNHSRVDNNRTDVCEPGVSRGDGVRRSL